MWKGTPFYVMAFVEGRIYTDLRYPFRPAGNCATHHCGFTREHNNDQTASVTALTRHLLGNRRAPIVTVILTVCAVSGKLEARPFQCHCGHAREIASHRPSARYKPATVRHISHLCWRLTVIVQWGCGISEWRAISTGGRSPA